MHLLSKIRCNLLLLYCNAIENTYEDAFITSYHIIHVIIYAFVISYFMLMHIGSSKGITLLEFNEEEEEDQQEMPWATTLGEEEQTLEDLPECSDHRPTSFRKGKPQSILSLLYFKNVTLSIFTCLMH